MPAYEVQRSIDVAAPASRVFAALSDLAAWRNWSPWLCPDPAAQATVSSDPAAAGSVCHWSDGLAGEGELEHIRLDPPQYLEQELRFTKPYPSTSHVAWSVEASETGAKISWRIRSSLPWFLFWMRSQLQAYRGADLERGLRMLKQWIELGAVLSRTEIPGVQPLGPLEVAGLRDACTMDAIGPSMDRAFTEAGRLIARCGLGPVGDAVSVYHQFDFRSGRCEHTSGFVIPPPAAPLPPPLVSCSIPAGRVLAVQHTGDYQHLGNAWSAAYQYARYKRLKLGRTPPFEIYRSDPQTTPPTDRVTLVCLPLRRTASARGDSL